MKMLDRIIDFWKRNHNDLLTGAVTLILSVILNQFIAWICTPSATLEAILVVDGVKESASEQEFDEYLVLHAGDVPLEDVFVTYDRKYIQVLGATSLEFSSTAIQNDGKRLIIKSLQSNEWHVAKVRTKRSPEYELKSDIPVRSRPLPKAKPLDLAVALAKIKHFEPNVGVMPFSTAELTTHD